MMMVQGAFVYVKAQVRKRSWNDQLEIKISAINLLSDVLEKLTKSVTLRINLFDVNEVFVDQFKNLIEEHKGPHQLKFHVFDPDESVSLDFLSRSYKVRISKQLIHDIGTLIDVSYKLN